MINEYYLPQKIDEKLKMRFLKPTVKVGEEVEVDGFLVDIPKEKKWLYRRALWEKISPYLRDFDVKGITPFPAQGFPVLPVVIPYWLKIRGKTGSFAGKILDFSDFSSLQGRFLLLEKFVSVSPEKYLLLEETGLDGRKIYRIFDSSFSELSRDVMLTFFMSSSPYVNRIGGCTITFLESGNKYYHNMFPEFRKALNLVNPLLHKSRISVRLIYDDYVDITFSPRLKIKYATLRANEAERFFSKRSAPLWEKSAITSANLTRYGLINLAEVPYLGVKEEGIIDNLFAEYSVDILSYVIGRHLTEEPLDEKFVDLHKKRFLRIIDSEFPLLAEAMRLGIVMDIANINGFGEHIARLINAWDRIGYTAHLHDFYITIIERVYDLLYDRLRRELSSLGEKKRIEKIINRVLWELNTLRPDGWNYEYFEKKMHERGIEDRTEKIFHELITDGIIIMVRNDLFKAVGYL